jgi:hypothetical protein
MMAREASSISNYPFPYAYRIEQTARTELFAFLQNQKAPCLLAPLFID